MIEIVAFVPSEHNERARLFDDTIERARHAISALAIANTLPTEELSSFRCSVDGLFLPNVSHGLLSIPTEYRQTDNTPMLVTSKGDETKYHADSTFLEQTPQQEANTIATYHQLGWTTERFLANKAIMLEDSGDDSRLILPDHDGDQAYVISQSTRFQKQDTVWAVMSRPIIRVQDLDITRPARASILYHEDVHKKQRIQIPVDLAHNDAVRYDNRLRRELEAYDKQHKFDRTLIATGLPEYEDILCYTQSFMNAAVVELNPPDDPYAPSEVVKRAIVDRDLILIP